MTGSSDLLLVATSFLIAAVASHRAFDLAAKVGRAEGYTKRIWLAGSSIAVGIGIWSVHFLGMLAFALPVTILYSFPRWFASIGASIVVAGVTIYIVTRPNVSRRDLIIGTPWIVIGLAVVHFTGMASIGIPGRIDYHPLVLLLLLIISGSTSFVVLWVLRRFSGPGWQEGRLTRIGGAIVMAFALSMIHFAGMASVQFHEVEGSREPGGTYLFASGSLSIAVLVITALVIALAYISLGIDRRVRKTIQQSKRMQELKMIRRNEVRFESLVQRSSDVILILGVDSEIRYSSPAVERVFGYTAEEVLRRRLLEFIHPEDIAAAADYLVLAKTSGTDMPPTVWRLRHHDRTWRYVESAGATLHDEMTGDGLVLNSRDITDRVNLEAQLTHQAFHDALTGLANRSLFRDRVEHALSREARRPGGIAVLFLDLDDFKMVNDSLGHAAGDRLLGSVAARLTSATRGCDTVARLGGDEFAVLLDNVRAIDDAVAVAERILAAFQDHFVLDGKEVRIGTSVGLARVGAGEGAEELLRNADLAMYRAKRGGKGSYEIFAPEMHSEVLDRLELEADLRAAIGHDPGIRGEFKLVYQPIVDLRTERLIGLETLLRWDHPLRGRLPTDSLIGLAEATGLILPLGRWILFEACRQVASWSPAGTVSAEGTAEPPDENLPAVTVNISGLQLQNSDLVTAVKEALSASGLPAHRLVLEITESVILEDTEQIISSLHALKELGIKLAIDDFGTGYSSLSYLQKFPLDILKIDKTFIDGITAGGQAAALTRIIIALGDMMSLRLVAEGIEELDQCLHLRALGCGYGQGYFFAEPLDADDAEQVVRTAASSPFGAFSGMHRAGAA